MERRSKRSDALTTLPRGYERTLRMLKLRIAQEQRRAIVAVNSALVLLYWDVGSAILEREERAGWGARVIARLSADLRGLFPGAKGYSPRNLRYMRDFARAWGDRANVQQLAAQLPWYHHCVLLDRISDQETRVWYVEQAVREGWSRATLTLQIKRRIHARHGRALTNFERTLPRKVAGVASQLFKDPFLFDFLDVAVPIRERELERSLIEQLPRLLMELGAGFAFVGRQFPVTAGSQEFLLDLLFYHLRLRCFVVVELKAVEFEPEFVGKLNAYLSAVDDQLRHPGDRPTIGLLLCSSKDSIVVEYALRHLAKPIGVAQWDTSLVRTVPRRWRRELPSVEELETRLRRLREELET